VFIIIIIFIFIPLGKGLKAKKLKSKLEWLLVRNVVDHENGVQ